MSKVDTTTPDPAWSLILLHRDPAVWNWTHAARVGGRGILRRDDPRSGATGLRGLPETFQDDEHR